MESSQMTLDIASDPIIDQSYRTQITEEENEEDIEFMEIDGISEDEEVESSIENFDPGQFNSTPISNDILNVTEIPVSIPQCSDTAVESSSEPQGGNIDGASKDQIALKGALDVDKLADEVGADLSKVKSDLSKVTTESQTDKRKKISAPMRSRSRSKSHGKSRRSRSRSKRRSRRSRSRSKRRSRSRSCRRSHSKSKRRSGRRSSRSRSRKRSNSRSTKSKRSHSRSRKRSRSRDHSKRKSPVAKTSIDDSTNESNVINDNVSEEKSVLFNDTSETLVEPVADDNTENEKTLKDKDDSKTSSEKQRSRSKSRERKQSSKSSKSSSRKRSRFDSRSPDRKSKSPEKKRQRKSLSEKMADAKSRVPVQHQRSPLSKRKRHVGDKECPPPSQCIIVFGLPLSYREVELEEMWFPKYEGVNSSVIVDQLSGISRGFGFVNFSTVEQAAAAMNTVQGMMVDGDHEISCKFSITKKRHTPTPNHYLGDKKTVHYLAKPKKFDGLRYI